MYKIYNVVHTSLVVGFQQFEYYKTIFYTVLSVLLENLEFYLTWLDPNLNKKGSY